MGKNSGSTQTVTQRSDPWGPAQPYLLRGLQSAGNLYNRNQLSQGFNPTSSVVPFAPQSQLAMNLTQNRALQGSPITNAARGFATDMLQGNYLNSNPYIGRVAGDVADKAQRAVDSQFARAGRYGSPAAARAAAEGVGNAVAPLYMQNYQMERDRQMQALGGSPALAAADYADIGALGGVGGQMENKAAQYLLDQQMRFGAPMDALQNYINMTTGQAGLGGTATGQQPIYGKSPIAGAIGGGLAGAGIASAFPAISGPWGAGIGAGLGLLGLV